MDTPAALDCKITLLETQDEVEWRRQGDGVSISVPESLRAKVPYRQAYVLKVSGVRKS